MMRGKTRQDIGIIGAGWSGLAAAIELAQAGHTVTVYESAKSAGGRARRVETEHGKFDNGQHLLIGAYSETLRLMETVSPGSSASSFLRLPLTLDYPDGVRLHAPRLPAPLHLAAALLLARWPTVLVVGVAGAGTARLLLAHQRDRSRQRSSTTNGTPSCAQPRDVDSNTSRTSGHSTLDAYPS